MAKATVVSLQRLTLFKTLQDELNAGKFLGIHATADDAAKLHSAVTIDGVSFDGSANITLPTKVVQVWSNTVSDVTTYYSDAGKTTVISTFDVNKLYIDMTTNEHKHYNGTTLVSAAASDNTARIPMSMKGAANGVAELDAGGLVPSSQLPSYVDDIVEIIIDNGKYYLATASGTKGDELTVAKMEKGKIYVDINATIDGQYRFSGTGLVAVGNSVSTADQAVNDTDGNPIKTTYVKLANVGTGLTVTGTNVSLAAATADTLGGVKTGTNIQNASGVISVNTATSSTLGVASFGTGLSIADGNVSIAPATDSVIGGVITGTNIQNSSGTISVNTATDSTLGVAKFGTGLTVTNGNVTIAAATSSVLGGVKNGTNIQNTDGTLSVNTATSSVLGVASFGTGLTVANGNVTIAAATSSVLGGVKNGTNINNNAGTLSVNTFDGSNNGVVPQPSTATVSSYLAADGTWGTTATATVAGLMSATDKSNLDSLVADAYEVATEAQIRAMFD